MNHPDFKKFDTSSMVGVGGGGAAFAAPMIKRVKDLGASFVLVAVGQNRQWVAFWGRSNIVFSKAFWMLTRDDLGRPAVSNTNRDFRYLDVQDTGQSFLAPSDLVRILSPSVESIGSRHLEEVAPAHDIFAGYLQECPGLHRLWADSNLVEDVDKI